jgi:hypothetical protein
MPRYDIFELFPDGSFSWRACVSGLFNKERKLQEFAEASENQFCAIDIEAGETLPVSHSEIPVSPDAVGAQAAASLPDPLAPRSAEVGDQTKSMRKAG